MLIKGTHRHMKGSMVSDAPLVLWSCLHPYYMGEKKSEWSKSKITISFEAKAYKIKWHTFIHANYNAGDGANVVVSEAIGGSREALFLFGSTCTYKEQHLSTYHHNITFLLAFSLLYTLHLDSTHPPIQWETNSPLAVIGRLKIIWMYQEATKYHKVHNRVPWHESL